MIFLANGGSRTPALLFSRVPTGSPTCHQRQRRSSAWLRSWCSAGR
jgi:hypothetical protein